MRYEVMRLMQFLFSLSLIVVAFAGGVFAGWYRWAPRSRKRGSEPRQSDRRDGDSTEWSDTERWSDTGERTDTGGAARSTLFSPVGEIRPRHGVTVACGPVQLLSADEIVDLRGGHPSGKPELEAGSITSLGVGPVDGSDSAQLDH